ncbi:MAG: hypothetical protein ACRC2T_16110 [Thermoguttaceae bacterium]
MKHLINKKFNSAFVIVIFLLVIGSAIFMSICSHSRLVFAQVEGEENEIAQNEITAATQSAEIQNVPLQADQPENRAEAAESTERANKESAEAEPVSGDLTASETPWGAFLPGSGTQTRTITTTFQDSKVLRGYRETKTTLFGFEPQMVVLKQNVAVEIGGKMVPGEVQTLKYDFYQQPIIAGTIITKLQNEKLKFGKREITCEVRRYEHTGPQFKRVTKVWYNSLLAPYVLCTETMRYSLPSTEQPEEKLLGYTKTQVVYPPSTTLRGTMMGIYQVKTIRRNTEGWSETVANHSLKIPGTLKREQTYEYDINNNLTQIVTTTTLSTSVVQLTKEPKVTLLKNGGNRSKNQK